MKQYIRINSDVVIFDVDGCFIFFLHEIVVYRHFHIFNMDSKMAAKGHVTIFFIIGSIKSFIY